MSGPTDWVTRKSSPDNRVLVLRAAAEFFAEEALTFAAVLDEGEFELMLASDAVRLFGARLCQIAHDLADPLLTEVTTLIPHHGLIS